MNENNMNKLSEDLKNILEVEELDLEIGLLDYDSWDSLTRLSIIALLEDEYGIRLKANQFESFENLGEFIDYVIKNRKK
jgi:acyl carrier protein